MVVSLTHAFTSGKADGADSTLVQPSHWNAEHAFTMATSRVLGRVTDGSGSVEELSADQIWTLLGIVSGTKVLFQQSSAPTGFIKNTSHDDKTLRVVSGSVVNGGSQAFSTCFASGRTVSGTALTQAQLPNVNLSGTGSTSTDGAHTHSYSGHTNTRQVDGSAQTGLTQPSSLNTGSAGNHSHTVTVTVPLGGSGATHNHTIALDVAYVDVIIASKS